MICNIGDVKNVAIKNEKVAINTWKDLNLSILINKETWDFWVTYEIYIENNVIYYELLLAFLL